MFEDRERTQLILLRILGVLLVAVGVTMLFGQVRSQATSPVAFAHAVIAGDHAEDALCERHKVHMRKVTIHEVAPAPRAAPAAPAAPTAPPPPRPPSPPTFSF